MKFKAGEYELKYEVTAFQHFGGYKENPAFLAFHELSVRAFATFHKHVSSADPRPFTDLIRKMVYVAEATSVALRLNASWALTHPAFSLCRDRYEQCARFSWLARQTDDREWPRYIADKYLREAHIKRAFADRGVDIPELDTLSFDMLPEGKKKSFRHWDNLKLDRLAERRDELDGISGSRLDKENLRWLYDSIYRQGSSVSHSDLYSVNMLGLYEGPNGLVLAPDPALPIVTVLHCALFDLIQCSEALAKLNRPASVKTWDDAIADWWASVKQTRINGCWPRRQLRRIADCRFSPSPIAPAFVAKAAPPQNRCTKTIAPSHSCILHSRCVFGPQRDR